MESQPQNPEFRINPENFRFTHVINHLYTWKPKMGYLANSEDHDEDAT